MLGNDPQTGKRRRKTVSARSKTEVNDKLRQLRVKYQDGTYADTSAWTFGQLAERCLELKKGSSKPTTYAAYRYAAERLKPLYPTALRKLRLLHVDDFGQKLTASGLAPSYVHRILGVLKQMLRYAVKCELLTARWLDDIKLPSVPGPDPSAYELSQAMRLLEASRGHPLEALVVLALTSGLRRGELLGLHWSDIEELDDGGAIIRVRRNVVQPGKELIVQEPKTEASNRSVHVGPFTAQVLKDHHSRQTVDRANTPCVNPNIVFASEIGDYLNTWRVYPPLKAIAKAAGVDYKGLHVFRRTSASLLIKQHVDAKTVSQRLGHSNVAFTLRHYQHVFKAQQASAVLDLDKLPAATAHRTLN